MSEALSATMMLDQGMWIADDFCYNYSQYDTL